MQWHWRRLNVRASDLDKSHCDLGNFRAFLEQPGLQSRVCCLAALQRAWAGSFLLLPLFKPFLSSSTGLACWLKTAPLQPATACSHVFFDLTLQSGNQGPKKRFFESVKELTCKPRWLCWSKQELCAPVEVQFPKEQGSLFKDGISVLHCVLQHQHTHYLLLFDSSCAQGNRIFVNINTLVAEEFVDLINWVFFWRQPPNHWL